MYRVIEKILDSYLIKLALALSGVYLGQCLAIEFSDLKPISSELIILIALAITVCSALNDIRSLITDMNIK